MTSKKLFEQSLKLVPGGVHSPVRSFKGLHTTPIFVEKGEGAYLYDNDGRNYIDYCMSFGPLILGHQNAEVKSQLHLALDRGWSYGACEKYSLALAEFLVSNLSFVDQIRFVNSGTEAVMTALRLARGITGKNKILKFNGCYHGHVDSMLIKSGSGLAGTSTASSKGVTAATAAETLVVDLNDQEAVTNCFENFGQDIAAIIIEPLPANYGLLIQTTSFLKFLREIATKHCTLLIFDEVISGFRVGFGGMSERTGIIPDLVTYGKIIGGGLPVGAVAGPKHFMEYLAPIGEVYQAGTLSANPLAMVGGLATLKQLTPDFYQKLSLITQNQLAILQNWTNTFDGGRFAHYQWICQDSLFWPISHHLPTHTLAEIPINISASFIELFKELLNRGVYLSPNGYEIGFCSIAHNQKVCEDLAQRLSQK
jgi:glutamate-1-semialdehyde 2,1-aminomutase